MRSLDELVRFFDTHDMGEYWEQMPEVYSDIDPKNEHTSLPLTKI